MRRSWWFHCEACGGVALLLMEGLCRDCWRAREKERDPLAAVLQAWTDAGNAAEAAGLDGNDCGGGNEPR